MQVDLQESATFQTSIPDTKPPSVHPESVARQNDPVIAVPDRLGAVTEIASPPPLDPTIKGHRKTYCGFL